MTPQAAIADARSIAGQLRAMPLGGALRDCVVVVRKSIEGNFDNASEPDGPSWPPRKPQKDDDGHPLLDDTGFLKAAALGVGPGAITDVQAREAMIGIDTSVEFGGIPGARAHEYGNPDTNLPARPYYAPTEEALDECENVIGEAVLTKLLGG